MRYQLTRRPETRRREFQIDHITILNVQDANSRIAQLEKTSLNK